MGLWIALFTLMFTTGYIEAPHPGASIKFWKQAVADKRPMAHRGLATVLNSGVARGDGDAWNEMGLMYVEGKLIKPDAKAATRCFAQGARLGSALASLNLVTQHIFLGAAVDMNDLLLALRHLEDDCATSTTGQSCFVLGAAWETGRGRPQDLAKAREYYQQACTRGYPEACKRLEVLDKQAPPPDAPKH
jgi:TPR repeat protein